jgi:serine protease Do
MGVSVQEITDDLAVYFGLTDKKGVLIADVLKEGPGDKGGLKNGDIITRFDKQQVPDVKTLLQMVARSDVGKKVPVVVIRDKKTVNLTIEIGEKSQERTADKDENVPAGAAAVWRGMQVRDQESRGVVVISVEPNSPADVAGVTPGDVIQQINRLPVNNSADYQAIIKNIRGDVLLGVSRGYVILKENSEKSK